MDIQALVEEIRSAAQAYYQGDEQLMTDEEYDTKVEYLENLVDNGEVELTDEIREILYSSVSAGSSPEGNTITHDYPMLSLAKAKNSSELETYHKRLIAGGAEGFRLEMKFDGLALSAKFAGGVLTQLATRGDGYSGETLNHLIGNKYITIVGLPTEVESKDNFELRGELYISDKQFDAINEARRKAVGEEFSNSRNAVTGIVRRAEREMDYSAEITFAVYSAYKNGEQVSLSSIGNIEGISTAKDITERVIDELDGELKSVTVNSKSFSDLEKAVKQFGIVRDDFELPTDGVVIKPTNEIAMLNRMGFTSTHPIAYVAYKYPGEKAVTKVLDVIVSVGRTGRLTPQARVEPVEVDGVVINNITCHNYNWLNEMGIKVGSTVTVTRANDVIPAITSVVIPGEGDEIEVPSECPECGSSLVSDGTKFPKTLACGNSQCQSRLFYYIKSIVGRNYLYIDGLGDVALTGLIDSGVVTSIADLYRLDEKTLASIETGKTPSGNVRTIGSGNAKNIMRSIERSKLNTDSNKLLAALNIQGLGPSTAKRLIEHFGGIEEVLQVDPEQLREVSQVGDSLIKEFRERQEDVLSELNELIELGFAINDPEDIGEVETKGTFSVSGSVDGFANRGEFVAHMEKQGWEFHNSPRKDTDVMFADPDGTSSKIKRAKANNVRIVRDLSEL